MKSRTILLAALLLGGWGAARLALQPLALAASTPDDRGGFDAAVVARGARLAAIGNCATCHTREGGKPLAGGVALSTPFGIIYSTNITPDVDTGIGRWTRDDFLRAMHEGIDRSGRHLYPAFPYDHFTRVTDADVAALYAFVMTRDPEHADVPPNRLKFPANYRPLIAAWNSMYFKPGVYQPDPARGPEWNRGAYLVEGLGHCGACHTPRNAAAAEEKRSDLGGGEAEGWYATSLREDSPAPVPWTVDQLFDYLRTGHERQHGIAAGPMAPVDHDLARAAPEDVRAIAVYVASRMRSRDAEGHSRQDGVRPTAADGESAAMGSAAAEGGAVFAGACASCHVEGAATAAAAPVALGLTTSMNAPDPRNVVHVTLEGLWPEPGERGAIMPGFASVLTDRQLAALLVYLRARFTDKPPWSNVPERVTEIRATMKEGL